MSQATAVSSKRSVPGGCTPAGQPGGTYALTFSAYAEFEHRFEKVQRCGGLVVVLLTAPRDADRPRVEIIALVDALVVQLVPAFLLLLLLFELDLLTGAAEGGLQVGEHPGAEPGARLRVAADGRHQATTVAPALFGPVDHFRNGGSGGAVTRASATPPKG